MKAGFLVFLVSVFSLVLLLVRDFLLVDKVGFGEELDSYYLAMLLPMYFASVLTVPLGEALTAKISKFDSVKEVEIVVGRGVALSFLLVCFSSVGLFFWGGGALKFLFDVDKYFFVDELFLVAVFLLLISGLVSVSNALLNSIGKPVLVLVAQILTPILTIAVVVFVEEYVVFWVVLAMVFGLLINYLFLMVFTKVSGYSVVFNFEGRLDSDVLRNFSWLVLCALLAGLSGVVNFWLVSLLDVGSVTVWGFGSKLVQVVIVVGTGIMTAVFLPYISRILAKGEGDLARDVVTYSLLVVACLGLCGVVFVFLWSESLLGFISATFSLGWGEEVISGLLVVVKFGALQLPFVITVVLLFRFCSAALVSHLAAGVSFLSVLVNALLGFFLIFDFGVAGVAIAWALASFVAALCMLLLVRKYLEVKVKFIYLILLVWMSCLVLSFVMYFYDL